MAISNRRPYRSGVPGLPVSVRVEHVVLRDTQINKSSEISENGFFELSETQILVVAEFEVLPIDFGHLFHYLIDSNGVHE